MEHIIFYVWRDSLPEHVLVVLLTTITGVGHYDWVLFSVPAFEGLQIRDKRERVGRALVNANITDKYFVKGEGRNFYGNDLLKHALHNTVPDITRTVEDEEGNKIKERDADAIQLADPKINEICGDFTGWLNGQLPEFKQELADRYNHKFNCFVRPAYDGSHQTFSFLDLKGLGIPSLYNSQKNATWMLIENGGGIIDHTVGTGKTLIMCISAFEMKRLGIANKPMIIGLKSNVHEIADTFKRGYPNARSSIRVRRTSRWRTASVSSTTSKTIIGHASF